MPPCGGAHLETLARLASSSGPAYGESHGNQSRKCRFHSERCCLGPTAVLLYTLQGLFHPARKVREVYWKIYNNLYIGSQPAMVAAYPRIADDVLNRYGRTELDLFL